MKVGRERFRRPRCSGGVEEGQVLRSYKGRSPQAPRERPGPTLTMQIADVRRADMSAHAAVVKLFSATSSMPCRTISITDISTSISASPFSRDHPTTMLTALLALAAADSPPKPPQFTVLVAGYGAWKAHHDNPSADTAATLNGTCTTNLTGIPQARVCFIGWNITVDHNGASAVARALESGEIQSRGIDAIITLGLESEAKGLKVELTVRMLQSARLNYSQRRCSHMTVARSPLVCR